jgi:hypothetical protein
MSSAAASWLRTGAPQESPAGLPFLSHPRRFAWGSSGISTPSPPLPRAPVIDPTGDNRLPAEADIRLGKRGLPGPPE